MTLEETNILPGNTLTAIIATLIETGLEKKQLENSITSS